MVLQEEGVGLILLGAKAYNRYGEKKAERELRNPTGHGRGKARTVYGEGAWERTYARWEENHAEKASDKGT